MSPVPAPPQAARELHQRRETPPQELRTLFSTTRVSHPHALCLVNTYLPPPHPRVQAATEENPDSGRGPPEKLWGRGGHLSTLTEMGEVYKGVAHPMSVPPCIRGDRGQKPEKVSEGLQYA